VKDRNIVKPDNHLNRSNLAVTKVDASRVNVSKATWRKELRPLTNEASNLKTCRNKNTDATMKTSFRNRLLKKNPIRPITDTTHQPASKSKMSL
jgi:hypothetical protein